MSNANSQIESGPPRRWFQITERSLLVAILLVAIVTLFFGTDGCGLIGFHYPRAVENDPLLAPIQVVSVEGNRLCLEDGRVLQVGQLLLEGSLKEIVEASDNRVDLEENVGPDGSPRSGFLVMAKKRGWICGTPWVRPIRFRLIPDDVPVNRREEVGWATEQTDGKKAEKPQLH